jgi:hypothetical protein
MAVRGAWVTSLLRIGAMDRRSKVRGRLALIVSLNFRDTCGKSLARAFIQT